MPRNARDLDDSLGMDLTDSSPHVWLDGEGIIHAELESLGDFDLAAAESAIQKVAVLCVDRRRAVIVVMTNFRRVDREARLYLAGPVAARYEIATALIVKSPLTRAIGNFFLGLKPYV